jgi:DNA-binding LacI/PurR family transcriptional regulator
MLFEDLTLKLDNTGKEPKYNQVARQIEKYLMEQNVASGTRLPSERTLADLFGIAPMTLGRSLNELVRRGVLTRKVGSGTCFTGVHRTRRIGILCHQPVHVSDWYVGGILMEIYDSFKDTNIDLVFLVRRPEQYTDTIREYQLDGIIVLIVQEKSVPSIISLRDSGYPVVSVGIAYPELQNIGFGTDHRLSGYQATEYLISKGYEKIGIVTGATTGLIERERGYYEAMYNHRLSWHPDWLIRLNEINECSVFKFLKSSERPDALLLTAHSHVVPFYNLIKKFGLRIPEDIALIAFDNPSYAEFLEPSLTVFAQPIRQFTYNAMVQLKNMLTHQDLAVFDPTPSILIERNSCLQQKKNN